MEMGKTRWRFCNNSDSSLFSNVASYSYRQSLSYGQISELEKTISSLMGHDKLNNELAQVLALASHNGRISYEMVDTITGGDAEEVFMLSYKWRLLVPLIATRPMDWNGCQTGGNI